MFHTGASIKGKFPPLDGGEAVESLAARRHCRKQKKVEIRIPVYLALAAPGKSFRQAESEGSDDIAEAGGAGMVAGKF